MQVLPWRKVNGEKSILYFTTIQISDVQTNHIFTLIIIKNSLERMGKVSIILKQNDVVYKTK